MSLPSILMYKLMDKFFTTTPVLDNPLFLVALALFLPMVQRAYGHWPHESVARFTSRVWSYFFWGPTFSVSIPHVSTMTIYNYNDNTNISKNNALHLSINRDISKHADLNSRSVVASVQDSNGKSPTEPVHTLVPAAGDYLDIPVTIDGRVFSKTAKRAGKEEEEKEKNAIYKIRLRVLVQEKTSTSNGCDMRITTTYVLETAAPTPARLGRELVSRYLYRVHADYLAHMADDDRKYRFYLDPYYHTTDNKTTSLMYHRYKVGDTKTFESLFFPEKETVLKMIDQFTAKTGKFAVRGFPNKLGFMLHGPPGTGKTSLIKAIASYTKRNVVNVPLNVVKSDVDLRSILFGDGGYPIRLSTANHTFISQIEKTLFVIEDIDTLSSIVASKRCSADAREKKREKKNAESSLLIKTLKSMSQSQPQPGETPGHPDPSRYNDDDDEYNPEKMLTLGGLLNALDGVVDSPGRMFIMTTNHLENIDPALVRPGRVNMKIFLGPATPQSCADMMNYYCAHAPAPLANPSAADISSASNGARRHFSERSAVEKRIGDPAGGHTERAADLQQELAPRNELVDRNGDIDLDVLKDLASAGVTPAEIEEACFEFGTVRETVAGLQKLAAARRQNENDMVHV